MMFSSRVYRKSSCLVLHSGKLVELIEEYQSSIVTQHEEYRYLLFNTTSYTCHRPHRQIKSTVLLFCSLFTSESNLSTGQSCSPLIDIWFISFREILIRETSKSREDVFERSSAWLSAHPKTDRQTRNKKGHTRKIKNILTVRNNK